MEKRRLGQSDLMIAPFMLGGNVFGWTADEKASFAVLDAFLDAGFNAIDTADIYSAWIPGHVGGESETVLGKWFAARKNRDRVVLATKVGHLCIGDTPSLSRAQIVQGVEHSLKRLQTDYIDLYFAHRDNPEIPLAETLGAFGELIKAGKVRAIGASNYSAERLAEAFDVAKSHALPRFEVLEPLYNLYDRSEFEMEKESICRERGLGVVPYYALAASFLTGKYRSEAEAQKSARWAGLQPYFNPRGEKILAALDSVAARTGASPAQIAIAWLAARPAVAAPIASATNVKQLGELIAAVRMKLDAEAMAELDKASA